MINKNENLEIKEKAYELTGDYFLSALTLVKDENLSLDNEMWLILKNIKYERRYKFYFNLMNKGGYLTNFC